MVRMNDEEQVQRFDEIRICLVRLAWNREHHVQEILAVVERVVRIDERLPESLLIAVRGNRWQFGKQSMDRLLYLFRVVGIEGVLIES